MLTHIESGHWYTKDAKPFFEIERSDGKGLRSVTVKDARSLGLLPSVTTILSLIPKNYIIAWRMEQLALALSTTPRIEGEIEDEYVLRCIAESNRASDMAKEKGTQIHKAIQLYIEDKAFKDPNYDYIYDFIDQHKFDGICETTKANNLFAGTIDFFGTTTIGNVLCDFKTQSTKPDKPFRFYSEWTYQLAAYGQLLNWCDSYINVVISTTEKRIEIKKWSEEEMQYAKEVFALTLNLFRKLKKL